MEHNVAKVAAICHYYLWRLRQTWRHVSQQVATLLVLAAVMWRLD